MTQQSNTVQTEAGLMYLDTQDSLKLGTYGYYEPEETALIKQLLTPDWVCIDAGAHIGYFTLLMAKQCKWVDAFEPEESNFRLLFRNLSINKTSNVMPHKAAITDEDGYTNLYLCGINSGMHRVYHSNECTDILRVATTKIDDIVSKAEFIKMDIEGSEVRALKGMQKLLANNDIKMIMEFCPQYIEECGDNPKEAYDLLNGLGYSIRLFPRFSSPISYPDLELETNREPTGRNIFCVKGDQNV
jgi:FkbM family methyltransferase